MTPHDQRIAARQADVGRLGVMAAIDLWIENARTGTGPSWRWQEPTVLEVLSEKDIAKLERMYPAPPKEMPDGSE